MIIAANSEFTDNTMFNHIKKLRLVLLPDIAMALLAVRRRMAGRFALLSSSSLLAFSGINFLSSSSDAEEEASFAVSTRRHGGRVRLVCARTVITF